MSITAPGREHPLVLASRAVDTALDDVAGLDPMYLSTADKQTLLVELTRSMSRLAGLRAQVLAAADDLAVQTSNASAGTWLAVETRTARREAACDERMGVSLRNRWTQVAEAVEAGRVTWDQAGVLVRALDALPDDLAAELVAKAEAHLVAEASHFDPSALRRLGRHVLEVVVPDLRCQCSLMPMSVR